MWNSSEDMSGRTKVADIKEGPVVVEIYEKNDRDRIFYDIRIVREYVVKATGEEKRGSFLQQRDLRDALIAIIKSQKFVSDRYRENRQNYTEE